jgi:hypothetical protein
VKASTAEVEVGKREVEMDKLELQGNETFGWSQSKVLAPAPTPDSGQNKLLY